MTTKKDNLKESLKETKTRKKLQKADGTVETENDEPVTVGNHVEKMTIDGENIESHSSFDMLWNSKFEELDEWAKYADHRDEVFIKEVRVFSENVQRDQENIKAIAEQFILEFTKWEKTARDELLMSTTIFQQFFPSRSYEEINAQFDQIQNSVLSIIRNPFQTISSCQAIDSLEMIDRYIDLRKKGRSQYIKSIKQAANPIYESQKGFVNLFATQFKELIFPLNKYMEKTEEP